MAENEVNTRFVIRDSLGLSMSLMMVTQDTRDLVLLSNLLGLKRQVADGMAFSLMVLSFWIVLHME
jgi:hypothetical protein